MLSTIFSSTYRLCFQMRVGERAELEIPPEYAYGVEGYPPVYPLLVPIDSWLKRPNLKYDLSLLITVILSLNLRIEKVLRNHSLRRENNSLVFIEAVEQWKWKMLCLLYDIYSDALGGVSYFNVTKNFIHFYICLYIFCYYNYILFFMFYLVW